MHEPDDPPSGRSMSPLGGPDTYWERCAFQEGVRLIERQTDLSSREAAHALLQEYQLHPADAQQALREAVDAVIARHRLPHTQGGSSWRRLWQRLTR
jgi:hypothetical protein